MPKKPVKNNSIIGGRATATWTRQFDLIEKLIEKHGGELIDRRNERERDGKPGRVYVEFEVALPGSRPVVLRPETRYSAAENITAAHAASALMVLVKAIFVGIQYGVGLQAVLGAAVDPRSGYTLAELAASGALGIPALEDKSTR